MQNIILNTDSYKASHFLQYPPGTTALFDYVESRGGRYQETVFFGLQVFLKKYLSVPVSRADIDEAEAFWKAHGEPFNRTGWERIVQKFDGFLPVRIRAVPEGTVVPTGQVLVTVESTDPTTFWIASYIETALLRAIWYPTTVATVSRSIKKTISSYLRLTSDEPIEQLNFKLHDFGARGVSSEESAELGGMAHLVNFRGSDNVAAVAATQRYYSEPMAAYSIPAAEHSTVTTWGRDREAQAYGNMLDRFARPGSVVAVVSDSYDFFNALDNIWGQELRDRVTGSGATVVIRPDSGNPVEVVLRSTVLLENRFGARINSKGYKVLNHVRLLQGDGINTESIAEILAMLVANGFSADNVAFGMGGGLLQQVDRDTQRFAMKTSAAKINGEWRDVYKAPITDQGKASKRGRLSLYRHTQSGAYCSMVNTTAQMDASATDSSSEGWDEVLVDLWDTGESRRDWTMREIRSRADLTMEERK